MKTKTLSNEVEFELTVLDLTYILSGTIECTVDYEEATNSVGEGDNVMWFAWLEIYRDGEMIDERMATKEDIEPFKDQIKNYQVEYKL